MRKGICIIKVSRLFKKYGIVAMMWDQDQFMFASIYDFCWKSIRTLRPCFDVVEICFPVY